MLFWANENYSCSDLTGGTCVTVLTYNKRVMTLFSGSYLKIPTLKMNKTKDLE